MIDLHSHTKASDGDLLPKQLVELAISLGIEALAITDHDTVDGIEEAIDYARDKDILVIPGIEFEAVIPRGQMHILGLFVDYKNEEFINKVNEIHTARANRNQKFIEELNNMGFEITLEELKEVSNGKTIGKPHFAKIFLKKKYIETKEEMFDKYFNQPPLNKYKKGNYLPNEIIELIKKANGVAILAHPQSLKLEHDELIERIKELKSYGLDGIECYHSDQTPEQMKEFKEIANSLGLIYTKGSDYHGPIIKPAIELGTGKNGNIVNDEEEYILEILKQRAGYSC